MKFKDYCWYYYLTFRKPRQRPITQATLEAILTTHLDPSFLADMELDAIRTIDLQRFLMQEKTTGNRKKAGKGEAELSNHVMVKMRQFLIAVFRQAVNEELVDKNYAAMTSPISLGWQDSPVFTPEAQKDFLAAAKGKREYTAYVLLFYLGLRRSELLGLPWRNVDFVNKSLTVSQTLNVIRNKPFLSPSTKTKSSIRTLPLADNIVALLKAWKEQQDKEAATVKDYKNVHQLVFTDKHGKMINPTYFSHKFKAIVRGLDSCNNRLHVHSTRHSWATNMIHMGVSIPDVQALGGWSRPNVLLEIYSHTPRDSQKNAMARLAESFKL